VSELTLFDQGVPIVFCVDDRVQIGGRECVVRGVSPMSVTPPRVLLAVAETGELITVDLEMIEPQ
jgi:hypothetical protein